MEVSGVIHKILVDILHSVKFYIKKLSVRNLAILISFIVAPKESPGKFEIRLKYHCSYMLVIGLKTKHKFKWSQYESTTTPYNKSKNKNIWSVDLGIVPITLSCYRKRCAERNNVSLKKDTTQKRIP